MSDIQAQLKDFGPGQQVALGEVVSSFMEALFQVAPRLRPHLASGGVIQISTMSGMTLKLGFAPQQGGLIFPGGITPTKIIKA